MVRAQLEASVNRDCGLDCHPPSSSKRAKNLKLLLCAVALVLGATAVHAQWLEKVIYLPDSLSGVLWPSCIAGNPEFRKVYVSGDYDGHHRGDLDAYVIVIDSRTGEKRARIPLPSKVSRMVYNPLTTELFASWLTNTIVVDGRTDTVISTFECDRFGGQLCLNTVNGKVYRSSAAESLSVIDGDGDSVMAKVYVPGGEYSLTFDSVGNKLYCGYEDEYGQGGLLVIDGDADTVITDFPTPFTFGYAVVSQQHRRLYCAGKVDGSPVLVVVDTDCDSIVGTISGFGGVLGGLCLNELRDELYFRIGDTVAALDCSGDTTSRRLTAFPGQYVDLLWCLPERDRLICRVESRAYLLDLATGDTVAGACPGFAGSVFWLDQTEARLHCLKSYGHGVAVLDASTDSIVRSETRVGSQPMILCIATKANKVYAGDVGRGTVYSLDCASGRVKMLRLPSVSAFCYDSLDNKVYCSDAIESVHVIDCATDSVIAAVRTGSSPGTMTYVPRHNRIYVANWNGSSLTVINCRNDSAIRTLPLYGTPRNPLYNPERDEILVPCPDYVEHQYVAVVDCTTNAWVDTLAYTPVYPIYCQAVKKIYMAGVSTNDLAVLDAASDSLVATIPGVIGIAGGVNETDCKVYTLSYMLDRFVGIVDAKADTVTSVITSIPGPTSVTHDALNDKVYITSASSPGQVFVLDGPTDSILDSIPVLGHAPFQAVWNPSDGRVYTANMYSGSISVIRDSMVPGVQDEAAAPRGYRSGTIMRQLSLPAGLRQADVYDISGRRVTRLGRGLGNVGRLAPGVYFVREEPQAASPKPQAVRKIVVTR